MGVTYATRRRFAATLDYPDAANTDRLIDATLQSASRSIDRYLGRTTGLAPITTTYRFPLPDTTGRGLSWKMYFGALQLLSISALTADGETVALASVFLEPTNEGPPYAWLEIDRDSTADLFHSASGQQAIAVTGDWGATADTEPAGALNGAIITGDTTIAVTSGGLVDVGDQLTIGAERLIVTDQNMAGTGATISGALTESTADDAVTVSSAAGLTTGELLLIGSELMLITAISGTTVTVDRMAAGSTLAAHLSGAAVNAARSLTVTRGQGGTTAANHADAATITRWVPPELITELALAETAVLLEQHSAAWARTIGQGENAREARGAGIGLLRRDAYEQFAWRARHRAV